MVDTLPLLHYWDALAAPTKFRECKSMRDLQFEFRTRYPSHSNPRDIVLDKPLATWLVSERCQEVGFDFHGPEHGTVVVVQGSKKLFLHPGSIRDPFNATPGLYYNAFKLSRAASTRADMEEMRRNSPGSVWSTDKVEVRGGDRAWQEVGHLVAYISPHKLPSRAFTGAEDPVLAEYMSSMSLATGPQQLMDCLGGLSIMTAS